MCAGRSSPPQTIFCWTTAPGGTGQVFDWSNLQDITRPYILAGGLGPENLADAVHLLSPWGTDLSSGVETDGYKDRDKILAAVKAVRDASK